MVWGVVVVGVVCGLHVGMVESGCLNAGFVRWCVAVVEGSNKVSGQGGVGGLGWVRGEGLVSLLGCVVVCCGLEEGFLDVAVSGVYVDRR